MAPPTIPPPRLALLQARDVPVAVVLRRGPSKWVEVIRWDLATDTFERGHWFHGRIYDRRSDVSPDGELLVYFANRYGRRTAGEHGYTDSWTAVSRVPWLTALALWPTGDCWWGGGLFTARRALWLNHRPEAAIPHPDHRPTGLTVEANPEAEGENEPVFSRRVERDGWALRREGLLQWRGLDAGYRTVVPHVLVKRDPTGASAVAVVMERRVDNLRHRERFRFEGAGSEPELPPGPVEWVDWDRRGRLLALAGGRVWMAGVTNDHVARFAELLDLRHDRPAAREAPREAAEW